MIGSILIFLLVLSILVLVHELGHFLVAKRNGVGVEEFGLGLPFIPKIYGKKIGGTTYSIYPILFGGFVRLYGESETDKLSTPTKAFLNKSKKTRTLIVIAGVIMNIILAIVAFAIVYSFTGIPKDTGRLKILDIAPGSPALSSGLVVGDIVKTVDGNPIHSSNDFISYMDQHKGKKVVIETENGKKVSLVPRLNPPQGEGPMGVVISTVETYYPPIWQRPFYGIYYGFKDAYYWGKTILAGLFGLFASLFKGSVPAGISGPIGIYAVTTEAAKAGILTLINFIGILSINLAILNILPFPALDGGRLLFIGIEAVIGKKIIPKVEATIHTIGMVILLAFILAITIGDIRKLILAGNINGFINSLIK